MAVERDEDCRMTTMRSKAIMQQANKKYQNALIAELHSCALRAFLREHRYTPGMTAEKTERLFWTDIEDEKMAVDTAPSVALAGKRGAPETIDQTPTKIPKAALAPAQHGAAGRQAAAPASSSNASSGSKGI